MCIFTMLNLLVEYYNHRQEINSLPWDERYYFPMFRCLTVNESMKDMPKYCDDKYQIDNLVFYPCGVSGYTGSIRGLVIKVLNKKGESLEVYGVKKETKGHYFTSSFNQRHWIPASVKYGWKIRGPWVKDIQITMKQFKKEMVAFKKLSKKKRTEAEREASTKEIDKEKHRIESFKSNYK